MSVEEMWIRGTLSGRGSEISEGSSCSGEANRLMSNLLGELPINACLSGTVFGEGAGKETRRSCNTIPTFKSPRHEPLWQPTRLTSPYCVLSANNVQDDFYTSCLSWGKGNMALALRDEVLLFQPSCPLVRPAVLNVKQRTHGLSSRVTSVAVSRFSDSSCFLGELDGSVGVYESPGDGRLLRTSQFSMPPPPLENTPLAGESAMTATASVRCFATTEVHPWLVAAGTAAQGLFILDSRSPKPAAQMVGCDALHVIDAKRTRAPLCPEDCVSLLSSAEGICGVSWNASGSLVATGGNYGVVNIWSLSHTRAPLQEIKLPNAHTTVKALAFHPTLPYELAVGGGTKDGVLRLYDVSSSLSQLACCVSTGCQITQALYSPDGAFIVSAQGLQHTTNSATATTQLHESLVAHSRRSGSDGRRDGMDQLERLTEEFERGMTRNDRTHARVREGTPQHTDPIITGADDVMTPPTVNSPPFSLVMWRRGMQRGSSAPLPLASMYVMTGHRSRPLHMTAPFVNTAHRGSLASFAGGEDNTIRFWKCFCPRSEAVNWEQRARATMRAAVTDDDVENMMTMPLR